MFTRAPLCTWASKERRYGRTGWCDVSTLESLEATVQALRTWQTSNFLWSSPSDLENNKGDMFNNAACNYICSTRKRSILYNANVQLCTSTQRPTKYVEPRNVQTMAHKNQKVKHVRVNVVTHSLFTKAAPRKQNDKHKHKYKYKHKKKKREEMRESSKPQTVRGPDTAQVHKWLSCQVCASELVQGKQQRSAVH